VQQVELVLRVVLAELKDQRELLAPVAHLVPVVLLQSFQHMSAVL
jgi:hypothetical protein